MASFITAGNATNGLQVSSDNTGILQLKTGTGSGTTAVTFDTGQRATFPSTISVGNTTPATTGAGITFPAAQSASSDANTLDDYEEGTWTPGIGGTATYSVRVGRYTKIGNIVTVYCALQVSLIGTGSTTTISGLPFTVNNRGGGGISYWGSLSQSLVYLSPYGSGTTVAFIGATAASITVTDGIAIFKNDAYVVFQMVYEVA